MDGIHTRTYRGRCHLPLLVLSFNYLVPLVGLELRGPFPPAETKAMCHYVFMFSIMGTHIHKFSYYLFRSAQFSSVKQPTPLRLCSKCMVNQGLD